MDKIISILNEIGLPYAYDHFSEGESPNPPFICYLLPGSDNFAADGRVYYKTTNTVLSRPNLQDALGSDGHILKRLSM